MTERKDSPHQDNLVQVSSAGTPTTGSLIADLGSKDRLVRARARQSLKAMGEEAVAPLVQALANRKELVRWEAAKLLDQIDVVWRSHADAATINALITDLGSKDGLVRVTARRSLVAIGEQAVDPLVEALGNGKHWVRWEAAKALGQIGNPAAAQALVKALEDEKFDVRWLAAQGLIAIGREALLPLLHELVERSDSVWLREGTHHVLHDLSVGDLEEVLSPLLAALEDIEPSIEIPFAAEKALDALKEAKGKRNNR